MSDESVRGSEGVCGEGGGSSSNPGDEGNYSPSFFGKKWKIAGGREGGGEGERTRRAHLPPLFAFRSWTDGKQGHASRIILVLLKDRETPLERWVFGFEDLLGLGAEEGGGSSGGGRKGNEV